MLIKVANTFTPTSKRKFLNLIIKRADEGFDETSRLHKLNIKFRLPLLSDSDGVIKHNPINNNNFVVKVKYFKSLGTPVNKGAPDLGGTLYSTVMVLVPILTMSRTKTFN